MTAKSSIQRLRRRSAVVGLALLVACVPATTHPARAAAASPCADSSYVKLRQQPPDSLSTREWNRLETLDRACAGAGAQAHRDADAMSGSAHGRGHWMGAGIATVIMVAMMISMY